MFITLTLFVCIHMGGQNVWPQTTLMPFLGSNIYVLPAFKRLIRYLPWKISIYMQWANLYPLTCCRHELIGDLTQERAALFQQTDQEGTQKLKENIREAHASFFKSLMQGKKEQWYARTMITVQCALMRACVCKNVV